MFRGLTLVLALLFASATFSQVNADMSQRCHGMNGFEVEGTPGEHVLTILDLELLEPAAFLCQTP